jgi:glycosyltransferase involved in cell wall biosynthesis
LNNPRVVFFSIFPFVAKHPIGEMKYNVAHMEHLANSNISSILICRLTHAYSRREALRILHERGVEITTEEHASFFLDRFYLGKLEVITFSNKKFGEYSISRKMLAPWMIIHSFIWPGSLLNRSKKSFLRMIYTVLTYKSPFGHRLIALVDWAYCGIQESFFLKTGLPVIGEIVRKFKPSFLLVDGHTTHMTMGLEIKSYADDACKIISSISVSYLWSFGPMAMQAPELNVIKTNRVAEIYHKMDGFVTPSRYIENYIAKWSGYHPNVKTVYPLIRETNAPAELYYKKNPYHGFVTFINPCNEKGISIFLEVAKALPHVAFAAVKSYGTMTKKQSRALESLPNVQLLKAMSPVDPIFDATRILLVPSVIDEAFGMVAIEAMLKGIPVIASDAGGLPEAKLGVEYVIPVNSYQTIADYFLNPGIQDSKPWIDAILELLNSPEKYQQISEKSIKAAYRFTEKLKQTNLISPFLELAQDDSFPQIQLVSN